MKYHCMVEAFAKAINFTSSELVKSLGHDGLGNFPHTQIQRTHHVQEILDVASDAGMWFAPIELVPVSRDPRTGKQFEIWVGDSPSANFDRFRSYLNDTVGVIIGMRGTLGHAVYWNGKECEDDRGQWELWGDDTDFVPAVYWRAVWNT